MERLVLAGVVTLAVTLLAQAAARGGLRRRNLTTAGHELEVAAKLAADSPLRDALELQARQRVARYLQPPSDKTVRRLTRYGFLLLANVVFVGMLALVTPHVRPWLLLIPGLVIGFFTENIENAVVARAERRRMNRERPEE